MRNSTVFTLRVAGIEAVAYESAAAFLENDDIRTPGCVILDVRMPDMNGLELQDEMLRRGIDLPIVFLTGHGDISMAVMALQKGAGDFCEKPVEPEREKEIIRLVADDKLNKVIAIDLGIQEHTVKIHRANACKKLGVRSALEAHKYLAAIGEIASS